MITWILIGYAVGLVVWLWDEWNNSDWPGY